jgi:hypothetical protein
MGTSWSTEDRDAVCARVRTLSCLPGVELDEGNGHTGFSVRRKRFAWLLVDHHDDGRIGLCVKAPPGAQENLVGRGCYFVPAYLGSRGWVGIDLDPDAAADWDEVSMLFEQAWRMCAPKRLVADLDDERRCVRPAAEDG